MKSFWRIDRVRTITPVNLLLHISFLKKYEGFSYNLLASHCNEFYNVPGTSNLFGSIVTQYNLLGLYYLNSNNEVVLSDTANLIYDHNEIALPFLEYFLLKFQFPRPPFIRNENIRKPFFLILKILLSLNNVATAQAFLTKKEFYYLFNESSNALKISDITEEFIANLLEDDRAWGRNKEDWSDNDDLSYDKTFLANSQFLTTDASLYNRAPGFYIGLAKGESLISFAAFILAQYGVGVFSYDSNNGDNREPWSFYTNNLQEFKIYLNQKNMLQSATDFNEYCTEKGFHYDSDLIRRYLTSLLAKPFLLLSGISGTGKSKIAELYGGFLMSKSLGKILIKAVGSNWTDNKNLLGYFNPLLGDEGSFISTDVIKFIVEANQNIDKIYIILLDEMNLSYTERYFSDFLSALESLDKKITLADGTHILWSDNLKIVGTINEDETTHTLSPKVIDRANIIEMNGSRPSEYAMALLSNGNEKLIMLDQMVWKAEYLAKLDKIYDILQGKFGYRTIDEITNYVIINSNYTGELYHKYLDEQIYQKLLPKLHGTRGELMSKLESLDLELRSDEPSFVKSLTKVQAMIDQLKKTGFTSFVTA